MRATVRLKGKTKMRAAMTAKGITDDSGSERKKKTEETSRGSKMYIVIDAMNLRS